MQSAIHEGYEYQDYFTVSVILELILHNIDAEITIDRKSFNGDKFDDLKVKAANDITEYQIKYSDKENAHMLTKADFSNGNGHDTALSDLFSSWMNRKASNENTTIKLCLAWGKPVDDDEINQFLIPIYDQSLPFETLAYKFDGNAFWPEDGKPPKLWKKFNADIQAKQINRDDFLNFCSELTVLLELPKASLDMDNAGELENTLSKQTEKLGVGIYPNEKLSCNDVIYRLATEVKRARAIGNVLDTKKIIGRLGFIIDYGKFDQRFPVDSSHLVELDEEIEQIQKLLLDSKRVILSGNPGSGKSWIVDEFIEKLENNGKKVIHYNCFHSLQDINGLKRIQVNSLYGNLVSQLIERFPETSGKKNTAFGADKVELENLLNLIEEDFFVVIDGLDHIDREYELHKDQIAYSETEIINELLNIEFPENSFVLISSQPIDDLQKFTDKRYCIHNKEPWKAEQALHLMTTYNIPEDEITVDDKSLSLSDYLISKSQGNALYLNYIIRQLRNGPISKDLIDSIPGYDVDLANYYEYLCSRIHNNRTVNALCGAEFYLSIDDLVEITGEGEYVEQDLSILHPLLLENILSGGYSIYHESFRRYVLAELKHKKVNIERNVYGLLADWLEDKPFFEFDKSFYYLTELLYRLNRDQRNLSLIDVEFVRKAVAEGYSRNHIKNNLDCIIRSAGRAKDLVALVTAGELLAMLDDLNEFESTGEEYFQAICDIKGPSRLNQIMQIDGKPTYNPSVGLLACYISSKAGTMPWWEIYLDMDAKEFSVENAKYYFRYYLDKHGVEVISNLMMAVEKEEKSIQRELLSSAYNEIKDYINVEEITLIAEENNYKHWKDFISYIKNGYQAFNGNMEEARREWESIKALSMPGKEDVETFERFFSHISHLIKEGDCNLAQQIKNECNGINWFYNWISYSINIAELYASKEQLESEMICQKALTCIELLLADTDVFKGKPRTCDLYFLQTQLTKSYEQALNLVWENGGLTDFEIGLSLFEELSIETATFLDGSPMGPLTDSEFLNIISRFLTNKNLEIVKPFLKRILERIESNEVYDSIAASKLRYVSLISRYDYTEAVDFFALCTHYLVAYGYHKDTILNELIDSYKVFFNAAERNTIIERDEITKMAMAVWTHTDRRETKHFLNHWYEVLLETEPKYAINFLNNLQIKYGRSWVITRMLHSVINKYVDDNHCRNQIIGLLESLPNDTTPSIIEAAVSVIESLDSRYKEISHGDQEKLLVKHHRDELITNILSRFNTLDGKRMRNSHWNDESIKALLKFAVTSSFNIDEYINYFGINEMEEGVEEQIIKSDKVEKELVTRFNTTNIHELKERLEKYNLTENDVLPICKCLRKYQDDSDCVMAILKLIISKNSGWYYSVKNRDIIIQIISQLGLDNDLLVELYMLLFLHSYEWGSSLVDTEDYLKSCQLNKEVAKEILYRELPEIIISNSGKITKGLLNAISSEDDKMIISIWKNVFDIMRLRFPNLEKISIDSSIDEVEEHAGIRNCLLMRFVDGGKEQFLAAYAYIANAAEEKQYSEFLDAIVFCLEYFSNFNLVTKIAIAELISFYGNRLPAQKAEKLKQAIDNVYPTGNLLLDAMFSQSEVYYEHLLRSNGKHVPDLYEQEDIEFYLAEQLYELGKHSSEMNIEEFAIKSIHRDPVMMILKSCGIDYVSIYKKLHTSKELKSLLNDFIASQSKVLELNTVYKSYEIQYALHAIIERAYADRNPELIRKNIGGLIPDFRGMYRLFKCRDIQPKEHIYNLKSKCEPLEMSNEKDYVLIGCFETKKNINYNKFSMEHGYQGLVCNSSEDESSPFVESIGLGIDFGNKFVINKNEEALIELVRTHDCLLEDDNFLLPSDWILTLLKGRLKFDYMHRRYVVVDQDNRTIFVIKKWSSCYMGDNDYTGDAIPLYSGVHIYATCEALNTIKTKIDGLSRRIFVDSFSQNY